MILYQVKDGIPLEVIDELNLKDNDELFEKSWTKNIQKYYIVSKNDHTIVPIENIRRKSISKTDFITKSVQEEESLRDYENALDI